MVVRMEAAWVTAHDQCPCVRRRQQPNGVWSRRHHDIAKLKLASAVECGRFVGSRTPNAAVRHQASKNDTPSHRRASVGHRDLAAVNRAADRLVWTEARPLS